MTKLSEFDSADYLNTEESQKYYLEEVSEKASKENNPVELIKAMETVARAKGMAKTARAVGISREGLYKALSENGNPSFVNVCKILNALGFTFVTKEIKHESALQKCTKTSEKMSGKLLEKHPKDFFNCFHFGINIK